MLMDRDAGQDTGLPDRGAGQSTGLADRDAGQYTKLTYWDTGQNTELRDRDAGHRSVHKMAKSDCACAASDVVVGITEACWVKRHRARLVLGWVTAWEYWVATGGIRTHGLGTGYRNGTIIMELSFLDRRLL